MIERCDLGLVRQHQTLPSSFFFFLFTPLSESRPYARHNLNLTAFNLAAPPPPNPPSPPPPIAASFPLLSRLSPPFVYAALPLAAALMSVLSCGPPFHTAALTITSITSNYLAVFPLLALSPPFISPLELYAFQMGATAPLLPPPSPHTFTSIPPTPPSAGRRRKRRDFGRFCRVPGGRR